MSENHALLCNKNKNVIGKFKIETLKRFLFDELICFTSKAYSFICKVDNESNNKLKGISKSQSKNIKCEEYKKCLDGEDYENGCDYYILRSINHEMYLQQVKKMDTIYFR